MIKYKLWSLFEGVSMHAVYVLGTNSLSNNDLNMCDFSGKQKWKKGVLLIQLVSIFVIL